MIAPYINDDMPDFLYIATSPAEKAKLRADGWIYLMGPEPRKWLGDKYGAPGMNGLWRREADTWIHMGVTYANVDELSKGDTNVRPIRVP